MYNNKNKAKVYEQKRITNYFMISDKKYRLCYTPKGDTKKVYIFLNYHISKFGSILKKIVQLKKYDLIKIYTKSAYVHSDDTLNKKFFDELVVDDYSYVIYDLDVIRRSQDESDSLFCELQKKYQ